MEIAYQNEYPRRIRMAAIGCGGHAVRNIFPTFVYAPVDFIAACDLERDRADAAARMFGAPRTYTDHHQMLASEKPEAVVVVTNYDDEGRPRYPGIAIDCMNAGAHVWIEKPPAASVDEIRRMMRVSRESGKFVSVGFKKMFFPATQKVKEILSTPEFGPVRTITVRYPQGLPPSADRHDMKRMTWFLDHMVHPHSILQYLAGPIETLYVQRQRDGAAIVVMSFTSGAIGSLHYAHGQSGYSPLEATEVVGNGCNVVVENNVRVKYYRTGGPPGFYGHAGTYYGPNDGAALYWEPEFSLGQLYNKGLFLLGYAPEIRDFCRCVLEETPPAIGGLDDALEILRVYEAYLEPDAQVVRVRRDN